MGYGEKLALIINEIEDDIEYYMRPGKDECFAYTAEMDGRALQASLKDSVEKIPMQYREKYADIMTAMNRASYAGWTIFNKAINKILLVIPRLKDDAIEDYLDETLECVAHYKGLMDILRRKYHLDHPMIFAIDQKPEEVILSLVEPRATLVNDLFWQKNGKKGT